MLVGDTVRETVFRVIQRDEGVMSVVDSAALRQRRKRRHGQGDHALCRGEHCPLAGTVERDDVRDLRAAIEAELGNDPARLAIARRLVEQAAAPGQPGVAAVVALNRVLEDGRAGRSTPTPQAARDGLEAEIMQAFEDYGDTSARRVATDVVIKAEREGAEAGVELARSLASEEQLAEWRRANEHWLAKRRGGSS